MLTSLIERYRNNLDELSKLPKHEADSEEVKGYVKLLKKVIKDLNTVQSEIGTVPGPKASEKTKLDYNKMISGYGFYNGSGLPAQYSDHENQVDSGSGAEGSVMGEQASLFDVAYWTSPEAIKGLMNNSVSPTYKSVKKSNNPQDLITSTPTITDGIKQNPMSMTTNFIVENINKFQHMMEDESDSDNIEVDVKLDEKVESKPNKSITDIKPNAEFYQFDPAYWSNPDSIKNLMSIGSVNPISQPVPSLQSNQMIDIQQKAALDALSRNIVSTPVKQVENNNSNVELANMLKQAQLEAAKFVGARN